MSATMHTTIIYVRISTFRYSNPNHFHDYISVCSRRRAFPGEPIRLLHDMVPFQVQPRVSKLQVYFLKNHINWKFTRISASSPWEHDTESADKSEANGGESPKKPGTGSGSSRREKQGKNNWWNSNNNKWRWQPIIQAQEIGELLIQLGIVMFVMRLLRPGIPLPGTQPRTPTTFVTVSYSEFLSRINSDQVQKVEVDGVHIMFKLKKDVGGVESAADVNNKLQESDTLLRNVAPTKRVVYTTTRPIDIKAPYEKMLENDVEFGSPDKRSGGFINSALHTPGQLRNRKSGNSGATKVSEQGETVMFAEVAGVDEATEELEEIVEFLRNPDRYIKLSARPPRGVLLVGLPRTGKTLLAKAVAGEADVPFISCSASEFVELYVGMGPLVLETFLLEQRRKLHP